jgi:small subunit ribosomal protein S4
MGDVSKLRKKYATPRHPWEGDRIDNERRLMRDYGLKNKEEIWRMDSLLKGFKDQVKRLNASSGPQAEREENQLMERLYRLGILPKGESMDTVLALDIEAILDRRLQTVVHKQGLARTPKQARQFVVHEHITVDGQKVNVPSYLVHVGEEVSFAKNSPFKDEMHPERVEDEHAKDRVEDHVEETDEIASTEEKEAAKTDDEASEDDDEGLLARSTIKGMTKDEIQEYAKEEFDIELSTNDLKKEMIDQLFEEADDGE